MAIPSLPPLVIPPTQATPESEWPDDADAFVTDQYRWSVDFNGTTIPALNAAIDDVNYALEIAPQLISAVNYKGIWVNLSGPLSIPASVWHNGEFWILLESLSDVSAKEPGVSPAWTISVASTLATMQATAVLF